MRVQSITSGVGPVRERCADFYRSGCLPDDRHSDHLGSSRLATTPARTPYSTGAYAPFGESYKEAGSTDPSFSRNNEGTGNRAADFMYPEYRPNHEGRWISP